MKVKQVLVIVVILILIFLFGYYIKHSLDKIAVPINISLSGKNVSAVNANNSLVFVNEIKLEINRSLEEIASVCGDGKCETLEVGYLPPACDPVEGKADCNVLIYCPQDCDPEGPVCGDGECTGNEVSVPGEYIPGLSDNSYYQGNFICGKDCGYAA